MAKPDPSARTVLEPLSNVDLSSYSVTSLRSLAVSSISDAQSLIYIGTFSGSLLLLSISTGDDATATATATASAPKDVQSALDFDASKRNVSFLRSVSFGDSPIETLHSVKKLSFSKGVCAIAKRIRSSELESTNLLGISGNNLESSSASQRILQKLGGGIRANGVKTKEPVQQSEVLVRNGKMELYNKRSGSCIQTVTFGGEGVGPCVVANEEVGIGKLVAVATPTKVTFYCKVSSEEQIKDLLRKKNFKEAISLVEELEYEGEMSNEMLSFVHAQVGFLLLFDLHFEEAVNHFLQSETMQPSEWFRVFLVKTVALVYVNVIKLKLAIHYKLNSKMGSVDEYLEVSREKELTLSVQEGVDTLLMYLYRALNRVDDMEQLAFQKTVVLWMTVQLPWAVQEELETLLDDSGHLRTLAFLYASKGMSSKALAIWRILARNYSSGLWEDPVVETDLQDGSKNIVSGREIAAIEASKILEELSDQELVLQHLGWIADINPVLAVEVLTSKKRVKQLLSDEVIAAIDPKKVEILQRYLQWLIEDQDSIDTQFHTLYALSLAKSAIEAFEVESISKNPDDERIRVMARKGYSIQKVRARDIGASNLALKLEDSEAAEQYCAEIGRPDAYMQLLDMYLDPQNGKEPMFKAAVRLLHNHGESLDPLQVLETLSPDMPLQLASDTILRMLRARLHHHCQGQIVHNLSRAIDVDARLARLEERSRHVQINESLCDSCHARLGTKLFAMYPDDTIVCYKCFRRQGESTSVTGRNFKRDVLLKPGPKGYARMSVFMVLGSLSKEHCILN
ncbi:hypothetical protein GH714_008956 [Hevea brasiliensis]|uniref:Vacuolar sorting protein 39/Transforming growth factor beta receptor-associated zinc finger domain-containing protein n=1 Tax=Hevea brasiliensis TaxID=3981 RepID=A0A6A6LRG6_HEVBR|nr:hypothetical protein GH714_008956 [Hevea brasiliensis]